MSNIESQIAVLESSVYHAQAIIGSLGSAGFCPSDEFYNVLNNVKSLLSDKARELRREQSTPQVVTPEMKLASILGMIGNVDHSVGNGSNSAKMRGDTLNSIRAIANS